MDEKPVNANSINQLKKFLTDVIQRLEDETAAYKGFLNLLEGIGELDPRTEKMLLDLAKKDNRFMGRT